MNRAAGMKFSDTGQQDGHSGFGRRDHERWGSGRAVGRAGTRM